MAKLSLFERRRRRVRTALKSRAGGKPRLSVHRTGKHIYAQVIDDADGRTVAAASTLGAKASGANVDAAVQIDVRDLPTGQYYYRLRTGLVQYDGNAVGERVFGATYERPLDTANSGLGIQFFNHSLVWQNVISAAGSYSFVSSPYYLDSRGIETNLKIHYGHIKLFAGYSFIEVFNRTSSGKQLLPLTPKHKLGLVLIYEEHGNFRIGLEGYYTGKQKLHSGETVTDYWITGVMLEKKFGMFSLFLNFENFLDTRQSRYETMYTGSLTDPVFNKLYAPTDGRIINGGVKISLQ